MFIIAKYTLDTGSNNRAKQLLIQPTDPYFKQLQSGQCNWKYNIILNLKSCDLMCLQKNHIFGWNLFACV